ncbi:MAG: hypothetical protein HY909_02085 [Deltaproteobacteria bacterium]|nr:hypothetical protein [Deltaproteobacteria bacterium]
MTPGPGLSLEQAPHLSVPLRFYLGAPLFAAAAAVLVAVEGPYALSTRWTPATLAAAHLFALGFLAQVMAGSLLQLLPVVAGAPVPGSRGVALVVHAGLSAGSVLLPTLFLTGAPWALQGAYGALGVAFVTLVGACALGLARARAALPTVGGIALALASLAVAATLGLLLAPLYAGGSSLALGVRHLHPVWALAGWVGLLVVAVAFQVVPMFHLTPPYPLALQRLLAPALFLALAVASVAEGAVQTAAYALVSAGFALFAGVTARLQALRRRRLGDASLGLWRVALGALVLTSALAALKPWLPDAWRPRAEVFAVVVYLVGFAWSVVAAMLTKIVPFLCWFHLQARFLGRGKLPHLGVFLAERDARWLLRAHGAVCAALPLGMLLPALHPVGFGLFAAEALYLAGLVARAGWRYREASRRLEALPEPSPATHAVQ